MGGNFSRSNGSMFDPRKHYTSVRLQQGVPLVDADWNEADDIRKEELRSVVRHYVGEGVPQNEAGFCISPAVGRIVLTHEIDTFGYSYIELKACADDAADLLEFKFRKASRSDGFGAQLVSSGTVDLTEVSGKTLRIVTIEIDGSIREVDVEFSRDDGSDSWNLEAVAECINDAFSKEEGLAVSAHVGESQDFFISAANNGLPGRCLVAGSELVNECALSYTEQLRRPPEGAKNLFELSTLGDQEAQRVDTVYIDTWEREVDADEDTDLINDLIGIPTCVRTKREWLVRVAEGEPAPVPATGHAHYVLTKVLRSAETDGFGESNIVDLRSRAIAPLGSQASSGVVVLRGEEHLNNGALVSSYVSHGLGAGAVCVHLAIESPVETVAIVGEPELTSAFFDDDGPAPFFGTQLKAATMLDYANGKFRIAVGGSGVGASSYCRIRWWASKTDDGVATRPMIRVVPASVNVRETLPVDFSVLGSGYGGRVEWSVMHDGPGSCDENGTYAAPLGTAGQTAIVRATSRVDPEVYADALVFIEHLMNP